MADLMYTELFFSVSLMFGVMKQIKPSLIGNKLCVDTKYWYGVASFMDSHSMAFGETLKSEVLFYK